MRGGLRVRRRELQPGERHRSRRGLGTVHGHLQRELRMRARALWILLVAGCCPDADVRQVNLELPLGWRIEGATIVDDEGNTYEQGDGLSDEDCEEICGGTDCLVAAQCDPPQSADGG